MILESSVDDDLCLVHEHEPENFPRLIEDGSRLRGRYRSD